VMVERRPPESVEVFRFLPAARGIRRTFRALWTLVGLTAALIGVAAVAALVARFTDRVPAPAHYDALALVVTVVILYLVYRTIRSVCATYVTSSDIGLGATGVTLYLTEARSRFIPWESVEREAIRSVKPRPMFRLVTDDVVTYAIPVKKLSPLHVLAGHYYGVGFSPVFIVHSDHERYEQIVEQLRDHPGQ
jgi:hypothetical protein